MRVLIYIEPHPIRGIQTMFHDVAGRFSSLLTHSTSDFDVRMYCTQALTSALDKKIVERIEKRIIPATADEEELFSKHLVDWETVGITGWLSLMQGGAVADDYVQVLRRIRREYPFDIIVHWGENGAVTKFIEGQPITRVSMELGCTRDPFMPTVVADPFGTNGNAIVPRLSIDDLREIVDDSPMTAAEALYAYSANLEAMPYEQQFAALDRNVTGKLLEDSRKIAFLPLQLHDDANLLRFSPYRTVEEVVLDVIPRLANAGYLTVIKDHPGARAKTRSNSRAAFSLAKGALRPWADHVLWADSLITPQSNNQLMALADLVVTVNSSVGFEALFFDKVVSVLGDAVYKPAGLFPTIEDMASGDFDLGAYHHGIGILRRFMLGGYLASDSMRQDFSTFQQVALTIDAAFRRHGGDAFEIAKQMFAVFSPAREDLARRRMVMGGSAPGVGDFSNPSATSTAVSTAVTPKVSSSNAQLARQSPFDRPARRLLALTGASNIEALRESLATALNEPGTGTEIIRASGLVDEAFYLTTHRDVARAGKDAVEHWIRSGLREGRKPRADLSLNSVAELLDEVTIAADSFLSSGAASHFPSDDKLDANRRDGLARIRESLGSGSSKIAVVVHLYYIDRVPEILTYLANIPERFDLLVTVPDWGHRRIIELVRKSYPKALFYAAPDRGRDVGPFLDLLPLLLERDYEVLLRLHARSRSIYGGRLRPELASLWQNEALTSLLGRSERVSDILSKFRAEASVNQVGTLVHYLPISHRPYDDGTPSTATPEFSTARGFFDGGLFWARPGSLRQLIERDSLDRADLDALTDEDDDILADSLERLFGDAAHVAGGSVVGASVDPSEPLVNDLHPLRITMLEHLQAALVDRSKTRSTRLQEALAW